MSDDKKTTIVRIFDRLDKIDGKLADINTTLEKQHMSLAEHMRRTELLENELHPIVKHVEQVRGAGMLIGFLALIATIVSVWLVFKT